MACLYNLKVKEKGRKLFDPKCFVIELSLRSLEEKDPCYRMFVNILKLLGEFIESRPNFHALERVNHRVYGILTKEEYLCGLRNSMINGERSKLVSKEEYAFLEECN